MCTSLQWKSFYVKERKEKKVYVQKKREKEKEREKKKKGENVSFKKPKKVIKKVVTHFTVLLPNGCST